MKIIILFYIFKDDDEAWMEERPDVDIPNFTDHKWLFSQFVFMLGGGLKFMKPIFNRYQSMTFR